MISLMVVDAATTRTDIVPLIDTTKPNTNRRSSSTMKVFLRSAMRALSEGVREGARERVS